MCQVVCALAVLERVEVERQEVPAVAGGRIAGLREDGLPAAVVELDRPRIVEAAYPAVGTEVVIEGSVLLDEDHHVLDVGDPSGARGSGKRRAEPWRKAQAGQADRSARSGANEIAPAEFRHPTML